MRLHLTIAALFVIAAQGQEFIPGRYIVEFDEPGKATRAAVADKQAVRAAVEQQRGKVRDSLEIVMNALVVETDDAGLAELQRMPGVRKVHPVRLGRLEMNRAPGVTRAVDAWRMVRGGQDQAGAGMRIGIIDGGIDKTHPAFQDAGLQAPAGFPKGNREEDLAGTSNKIIVFRNYDSLSSRQPKDGNGHGTAVASAAAGVRHLSPAGEFSGIAPKAFLGAYKVYGDDGRFGSDVILRALEDAVQDGMDVVNMSLGFFPQSRGGDEFSQAVDRVAARGIIVTKSTGNYGPEPGMGSSPNSAQAISVGASFNDRVLGATVVFGGRSLAGSAPDGDMPEENLRGELDDATRVDSTGLACGTSLPAGSFAGKVLLIARGTCTFEEKLNNAARAGATGAVIYTDDRPVALLWIRGSATLPALMVSAEDGLLLKDAIVRGGGPQVALDFRYGTVPQDPNRVTPFSSRGPSADNEMQPEIVSVGEDVFLAAQKENPAGDVYSKTGYVVSGGTSFSAPIVAGAAALVKAARPGLTPSQYKSLLVNSTAGFETADGSIAPVMAAGAGKLDVERALRATTAAEPSVISFGSFGLSADTGRQVTIRNLGSVQDTFTVSVNPLGSTSSVAPLVQPNSFTLGPGEARTISVRFSGSGMVPGVYQGFLLVKGGRAEVDARIPYWYGANDGTPVTVALVRRTQTAPRAGGTFQMFLRVADSSGAAVMTPAPVIEPVDGGGEFDRVQSLDEAYPGIWLLTVRLGPTAGTLNTFRLKVGDMQRTFGLRP